MKAWLSGRESPSSFSASGGFVAAAEEDGGRVGFFSANEPPQKPPKQTPHPPFKQNLFVLLRGE